MRLLVVDDDADAASLLERGLQALGHNTVVARDGPSALALAGDGTFDGVVLDSELPRLDGLSVIARIRDQAINLAIIITSAQGELAQRIAGLDAGADDFLVKPADPREIDARLRAIARRAAMPRGGGIMRAGTIEVNQVKHRASRAARPLVLQNLEYRLLIELVRHADSVVTRQMLYRTVWNYEEVPTTNIVESYIRRLRRQLNAPGERDPIKTIRGVGYMLTSDC